MSGSFLTLLCLLAVSTAVFAACSSTTVNCVSRVVTASEICVDSPASCPKRALCNTSAAPYRCADDSCAPTPQVCLNRLKNKGVICPPGTQCWDGSCQTDLNLCPLFPPCPTAFDIRCNDMSCQQNCSNVAPKAQVFDDPLNAGIFCPQANGYLCFGNAGCFLGDMQCPDGSCAYNRSSCFTGPSSNVGGQKNFGGCNATQVRCFGARYGTCNNTVADCPVVPSRTYVMPFVGAIGPIPANFTLVAEDSATELGSLAVPAFLSASSDPLNIVVYALFTGDYLYPFDNKPNPVTALPIVGMPEETEAGLTFWRSDPKSTPPLDSPSQSVLSSIVKIYSPQLETILVTLPNAKNLTGDLLTQARALLNNKWNINVTMVAYPPKFGCRAPICLAMVGHKPNNTALKIWQCIDSNPVQLGPNIWSALLPVVDLSDKTHYAFIADYRRSRCTFPRVETIGGGLLAIGAIVFVVLGIIILANREKLLQFVQTSVFKSSG